jgi:hypothetical protein
VVVVLVVPPVSSWPWDSLFLASAASLDLSRALFISSTSPIISLSSACNVWVPCMTWQGALRAGAVVDGVGPLGDVARAQVSHEMGLEVGEWVPRGRDVRGRGAG